jgi:hypothetical protein
MTDGKFTLLAKGTCGIAMLLTSTWRVTLNAMGYKNPLTDGQEFIIVFILGFIISYFLMLNMFQNWQKGIIAKN